MLVIKMSVRWCGLGWTYRVATRMTQHSAEPNLDEGRLVALTANRIATAAAFCPVRTRCLEQSLGMYVVLRMLSVNARFRMGVRAFNFNAHAWIEYDGTPVNESNEIIRELAILPDLPT
jgi:hypothetical protein